MLTLGLPRGIRHCDGLTRREVMRIGAIGLGGLSLPHLLGAGEASARPESTRPIPAPGRSSSSTSRAALRSSTCGT